MAALTSLITCPVCTERYDHGEHSPKALPCLHTFCLACLKQIKVTSPPGRLKCAIDNQLFPCDQHLTNLKTDFRIFQIKDIVTNIKDEPFCDICLRNGDLSSAEVVCRTCPNSNQLCSACADQHRKVKTWKDHELKLVSATPKQPCFRHPNHEIEHFCKTCGDEACSVCIIKTHSAHETEILTEEVKNLRRLVKSINFDTLVQSKQIQSRKLMDLKSTLCTEYTRAKKYINQEYEALKEILEDNFNRTLLTLEESHSQNVTKLDQKIESSLARSGILKTLKPKRDSALSSNDSRILKSVESMIKEDGSTQKCVLPSTRPPIYDISDDFYVSIRKITLRNQLSTIIHTKNLTWIDESQRSGRHWSQQTGTGPTGVRNTTTRCRSYTRPQQMSDPTERTDTPASSVRSASVSPARSATYERARSGSF